jgi:hypothetical protein
MYVENCSKKPWRNFSCNCLSQRPPCNTHRGSEGSVELILTDFLVEKYQIDFAKEYLITGRKIVWLWEKYRICLFPAMPQSWKVNLQLFSHGSKTEALIDIMEWCRRSRWRVAWMHPQPKEEPLVNCNTIRQVKYQTHRHKQQLEKKYR